MNKDTKKRLGRTLVLAGIGLIVGGLIGLVQLRDSPAMVKDVSSRSVAGAAIGGDFELLNERGETVTQDAFAGQYKLIYFGFTYCPAICPTELSKMTQALSALGPDADSIQPIFITVDPERDTVDVMREYITLFHPRFTGLTGSRAQIDDVLKSYRIYAKRVDDPALSDYTMDHSSYIYFMSPADELLAIYKIDDNADFVARDIRARL